MCTDCLFCDINIFECTEWIPSRDLIVQTFRAVSRLLPGLCSSTFAHYNLPYTFYLPSAFCMSWKFHFTWCNHIIIFDEEYRLLWRPLLCIFLSSSVSPHVLSTVIQTPAAVAARYLYSSQYSILEVFRQLTDERSVKLKMETWCTRN